MKITTWYHVFCCIIATSSMLAFSALAEDAFYIYKDADFAENHFTPSGYMGDVGDIKINPLFEQNCVAGTCIQVVYTAKGNGPNACPYSPPCKWGGVYWLQPANNWGKEKPLEGKGFDLSGYQKLVFSARADQPAKMEFKVGGIAEPYGDSLKIPRAIIKQVTPEWQEFEIDLTDTDLTHIIGGFVWVTNWDTNRQGVTFYLDNIRFEKVE